MGIKIVMPKFTETMMEGTISKWYKMKGENVEEGEPLVQIVGEKLTYDVEAPSSGRLISIFYKENSDVPVNEVIAIIGGEGEKELSSEIEEIRALPTIPRKEKLKVELKVAASPLAKKLARNYGVDLRKVEGTGFRGRIMKNDVMKYIKASAIISTGVKVKEVIPLTGVKKTFAEKMTISSKIPQTTLIVEADASRLLECQKYHESIEEAKLSLTQIILKAASSALMKHDFINSRFENDEIRISEKKNIGFTVSTDYGLVIPVIKDVNRKTVKELADEMGRLADKARRKTLKKNVLMEGTFTVTDLGLLGVEAFIPLINPPEIAILGLGRVIDRPVAVKGEVLVKPTMFLCLSFDHRIVDGASAAMFLHTLKESLEGWVPEKGGE